MSRKATGQGLDALRLLKEARAKELVVPKVAPPKKIVPDPLSIPKISAAVISATAPVVENLFLAEIADVKPLKASNHADLHKPRPKPIPVKRLQDDRDVLTEMLNDTSGWDGEIETGDLISFIRSGLPVDVLRKLRKGHWTTAAEIDLHGETSQSARDKLVEFIAHSRYHGHRCVRIIHGQGFNSPNGRPVLRTKIRLSLSQRDEVLAFCDAAPADGGAGAVVVLLKST
jgi:DNA-nicking Smr family endonuclease